MDKLPNYEPSKKMLDALKDNFSNESLKEADASMELYVNSRELDYDNMCSVLSVLVSIEDISSMHPYSKIIQNAVKVEKLGNNFYSIKLTETELKAKDVVTPHVDQIVLIPSNGTPPKGILALMPHEGETTNCGLSNHRHVGEIIQVNDQTVQFRFRDNDDNNNNNSNYHPRYNFRHKFTYPSITKCCIPRTNQLYDVIFRAPRIPVRLMYSALEIIEQNTNIRRYLFPVPEQNVPQAKLHETHEITLCNPSIATNVEQLQAVKHILAGPNPQSPYIVFGPPGTGKTTTIVEAILQLYMRGPGHILVTAGSNSACDTIALRLVESSELDFTNSFVRFYSTSYKKSNDLLRKKSRILTNKQLSEGLLKQYSIVVATLCSVGRIYTCSSESFGHIFIDEAAASTEAEAAMAMIFRNSSSCHVILSGDNKQLGPVIMNVKAASLGLSNSLMDRLLLNKLYEVDERGNYDQTRQTRLRRNYRSHPEIVGIYNKLYYNGELIPLAPISKVNEAENWSGLSNGKYPILFLEVMGVTERKANSTSSFNVKEANVAGWMVLKLLCDGFANGVKVKQEDIGIVTPYLAQCKLLQRLLGDRKQQQVEVGSVESYQGREKNVIIASMVSSFKKANFLSNPRRMNVMLSRAKCLMILIGNPTTLNEYKDFEFIISQCKLNGNFVSQASVEDEMGKGLNGKLAEYKKILEEEAVKDVENQLRHLGLNT